MIVTSGPRTPQSWLWSLWVGCALLVAPACVYQEPAVVVTFTGRPTLYEPSVLRVSVVDHHDQAEQVARNYQMAGQSFPLTLPIATSGRAGDITVSVAAMDADGLPAGRGAGTVALDPDGRVDLAIAIEPDDRVINSVVDGFQHTGLYGLGVSGRQVASDREGGFWAVWESEELSFVRAFDRRSRPQRPGTAGREYALPHSNHLVIEQPAITRAGDRYLVVWSSRDEAQTLQIRATAFGTDSGIDAHSVAVTDLGVGAAAFAPNVVSLPNEQYAVLWVVYRDGGVRGRGEIRGRILDRDGGPASAEFAVASTTGTQDGYLQCAGLDGGRFACAWERLQDNRLNVWMRVFDASGKPRTPELAISDATACDLEFPTVAGLPGGGFAVAWLCTAPVRGEPDTLQLGQFDRSGVPMRDPYVFASGVGWWLIGGPDIAVDRTSETIAVIWEDGDFTAGTLDLYYRTFDLTGHPLMAARHAATTTHANQSAPSIAVRGADSLVAVWTDESRSEPDSMGSATRMRVLYPPGQ